MRISVNNCVYENTKIILDMDIGLQDIIDTYVIDNFKESIYRNSVSQL